MTDREKLIELLKAADRYEFEKTRNSGVYDRESAWGYIADHLLANGVRLESEQATSDENKRWIPVSERLPDELPHSAGGWSYLVRPSADVLVIRKNNEMEVAWYSYANGWWTTPDETFTFRGVTHWMPLPEQPKEENR